MKLVLSRKGFDSSSGGVPSPMFADGTMLSLPIPDEGSSLRYDHLAWRGKSVAGIVADLTQGRIRGHHRAHLDPDLDEGSISRPSGWMPLFGQCGSAQGHLRNQDVGPGDLFLFFGLFRGVLADGPHYRFRPGTTPRHVIWGWLQVGEVVAVDNPGTHMTWARYHPHFGRRPDSMNTLYIANKALDLQGAPPRRGAGVFSNYSPALQLTNPVSPKPSTWRLPNWFYPAGGRRPLTYHADSARWHRDRGYLRLDTVARGQEFVLDCVQYPEATDWAVRLLSMAS